MPTIVVADDNKMIRQGVRSLQAEADWKVVGEANNGRSAVELIARLRPDVAIVDVIMPEINGLEVIQRVKSTAPETRVVMLSIHAEEPYVLAALREGANAYVLKGTNMTILVEAIHQVLAGRRYLSPPLSNAAIEAYLQRATDVDRPIDTYEMLTAHEREVLLLAAQGDSDAEIGRRLSIDERVIESDRASILRKLGLSTQDDLVAYATKRSIIHEA